MKSKWLIVVVFAVAAIGIFWMSQAKNGAGAASGAAAPSAGAPASQITVLYSTEKKDWMEAAVASYQAQHPDVQVKLQGMGSLEAMQAILDGKVQPTVWSPADSLVLKLLDADWQTKTGNALFAASGEDAPGALVITPLVFVAWEDRANALTQNGKMPLNWKLIHDAVASDRGWPAVGGQSDWGFVKLGHTDPTKSNSGLQTLLLMTYDFYRKNKDLKVEDLLKPEYQTWVKQTEKGVTHLETSTGTFMTDMVRFGPSKYDLAVVYENLAIAQLENAQGRWGNLKVYYPPVTLWSDHPAAVLQAAWVTPTQQKAAREFLAYLRSHAVQERALHFGFRPADTSIPVRTGDTQNPFTRLASYGVKVDIPPVAQEPDANVVRNLLSMWTRVMGRGN